MTWDVFISHAGEDTKNVARPLRDLLVQAGLRVWLDENELKLGDSLRGKIDQGLARSRYGVVILSQAFFAKDWPRRELNGLAARESTAQKVILPVLHGIDHAFVARYSPILADKLSVSTDSGIEPVAAAVIEVVHNDMSEEEVATLVEASFGRNTSIGQLFNVPAKVWRHWLPWLSIAVCVCIIAALIGLLWYSLQPLPSPFRAHLLTTSVVFTLGDWQESAGIFSSDQDRVDIEFQSSCNIHLGDKALGELSQCPSMTNVRMQAMALPEGLQVYLDTESKKETDNNKRDGVWLRYVLQPTSSNNVPKITLAIFGNSQVSGNNTLTLPKSKDDGEEISISPGDGGDLEFRVRFRKAPADEEQIPVNGVNFNLRNHSAITGSGNTVVLSGANQSTHDADNGLSLHGLDRVTLERLGLDTNSEALQVTIAGDATSILLPDGSSQIELVPKKLSKWSSDNPASVVATAIGAFGTALAAMFYAIKEFALVERSKRK